MMSKRTSTSVAAVLGSAAFAIAAVPVTDAGATPTVPPNCHGQIIKLGLAINREELGLNGLGGVAHAFGVSVKEIQAGVNEFCHL
jgi:hypothetical protein